MYQVLWLVWHFVNNSSIHTCQQFLDIGGHNNNTVVDWFNFLREVCDDWMKNKSEKLGGPGVVVEIDESYMCGRQKNGKGRRLGEVQDDNECTWKFPWALRAVERGILKCFLERIMGPRSREVLLPILRKWLLPGTIVVSDCWSAYVDLDVHLEECEEHYTVNHSRNFVDPITGQHTQGVECMWHHLTYSFPPMSVQPHMLASYLSNLYGLDKLNNFSLILSYFSLNVLPIFIL